MREGGVKRTRQLSSRQEVRCARPSYTKGADSNYEICLPALPCPALPSPVLFSPPLSCSVLPSLLLFCSPLPSPVLFCPALPCSVLPCPALPSPAPARLSELKPSVQIVPLDEHNGECVCVIDRVRVCVVCVYVSVCVSDFLLERVWWWAGFRQGGGGGGPAGLCDRPVLSLYS